MEVYNGYKKKAHNTTLIALLLAPMLGACSPFSDFCEKSEDCEEHELCEHGSCTPKPITPSSPEFCRDKSDFTRCKVETNPDRSYDICSDGDCVSPGCGDSSCNAPGLSFALPDTRQEDCYDDAMIMESCPATDESFYGQDGQYTSAFEEGIDRRFNKIRSLPSEPIVEDRVTRLVWQGCPVGYSGENCGIEADTYLFNWDDGLAACDRLAWGGFDDWRLPDYFELLSIVDRSRSGPAIDPEVFPGEFSLPFFWTSSMLASSDDIQNWVLLVYPDGETNHHGRKNSNIYVRCVRSGATPLAVEAIEGASPRFSRSIPDEGQPIVEDRITSLVWQGCSAGQDGENCDLKATRDRNWEDALRYCEELRWGTYDDWRLPNINALWSIVDTRRYPAIDAAAFPNTKQGKYWSSTSSSDGHSSAWNTHFSNGFLDTWDKTESYAVRCVRGGL